MNTLSPSSFGSPQVSVFSGAASYDDADALRQQIEAAITALELPGQIEQALAAGLINAGEAATLRDYDRKVMHIIDVDDFAPEELMAAVQAEPKESGAGAARLQVA